MFLLGCFKLKTPYTVANILLTVEFSSGWINYKRSKYQRCGKFSGSFKAKGDEMLNVLYLRSEVWCTCCHGCFDKRCSDVSQWRERANTESATSQKHIKLESLILTYLTCMNWILLMKPYKQTALCSSS